MLTMLEIPWNLRMRFDCTSRQKVVNFADLSFSDQFALGMGLNN
jgi:hypothetical protein